MIYIPIRPDKNDKGQLVSLLPFAPEDKPDEAVPPALTTPKTPESHVRKRLFTTSMEVGVELRLAAVFDASVGGFQDLAVHELRVGFEDPRDDSTGRLIRSVYRGSSLRITLRASSIDTETSLTFGAFAAQAEASHSRVEYEMSLLGDAVTPSLIADVLEGLPISGKFDYDAYATFKAKQTRLTRAIVEVTSDSPTTIVGASINYTLPASAMEQAKSAHFAMYNVARGKTLAEALAEMPSGFDRRTIESFYKLHVGADEVPDSEQREKARRWLHA